MSSNLESHHNPYDLPLDLPVPIDDGLADALWGASLPRVMLDETTGDCVSLETLRAPTLFFFYPRTGVPGEAPNLGFSGEEWDSIPGARGCTPQSCAYRDMYSEFVELGVLVYGVSTQRTDHQRAFKERNHVPFEFLSDSGLSLVHAMNLPTLEFPVESGGPNTLIRRMSWFVEERVIRKVWYPVFPPDKNAFEVLTWLRS